MISFELYQLLIIGFSIISAFLWVMMAMIYTWQKTVWLGQLLISMLIGAEIALWGCKWLGLFNP